MEQMYYIANTVLVDADAVCQQTIKTTMWEKDKNKLVLNCQKNI